MEPDIWEALPQEVKHTIVGYLPSYMQPSVSELLNRDMMLRIEQVRAIVSEAVENVLERAYDVGATEYGYAAWIDGEHTDIIYTGEVGIWEVASISTRKDLRATTSRLDNGTWMMEWTKKIDIVNTIAYTVEDAAVENLLNGDDRLLTIQVIRETVLADLKRTLYTMPVVQRHAWLSVNLMFIHGSNNILHLYNRYKDLGVDQYDELGFIGSKDSLATLLRENIEMLSTIVSSFDEILYKIL